ncbi:MAG: hypothetical protein ACI4QT_04820, partial [Kiritimatiellia bacterium]
ELIVPIQFSVWRVSLPDKRETAFADFDAMSINILSPSLSQEHDGSDVVCRPFCDLLDEGGREMQDIRLACRESVATDPQETGVFLPSSTASALSYKKWGISSISSWVFTV